MEVDSISTSGIDSKHRVATILCYNCGAPIDGTSPDSYEALCHDCIALNIDISTGIQREGVIHTCRDCDRWLSPPSQWVAAAPESRELLALCLKKLKGLSKVRIVDASFIWTEPHSRRVKVKISIQQEASAGTILQQTFEVEFSVHYHQCPDCAKSFTHNVWKANVQVRQKVPHKRTFLYLEQLILKHGAHKDTINIKEVDSGIDFYFAQKNTAEKFVDFLTSVVPVRVKKSGTHISTDVQNSVKSTKFSFSVEILPICKDDLVALPLKLAKQMGNISPITLCYRIGTSVYLLDPNTLQTADLSTPLYWRGPFASLADVRELTEFIVMDIEPLNISKGRFQLAEATVRRMSDLGNNDTEFTVRTHLGAILSPGDSVMGYHLSAQQYNSPELEDIEASKTYSSHIPDVVLVRKIHARSTKRKGRSWKLKRMAREDEEASSKRKDQDREEADYEMFLRDVEEDEELRGTIDLYKARQMEKRRKAESGAMEGVEAENGEMVDGEHEGTDDGLEIPLEQLKLEDDDDDEDDN